MKKVFLVVLFCCVGIVGFAADVNIVLPGIGISVTKQPKVVVVPPVCPPPVVVPGYYPPRPYIRPLPPPPPPRPYVRPLPPPPLRRPLPPPPPRPIHSGPHRGGRR